MLTNTIAVFIVFYIIGAILEPHIKRWKINKILREIQTKEKIEK